MLGRQGQQWVQQQEMNRLQNMYGLSIDQTMADQTAGQTASAGMSGALGSAGGALSSHFGVGGAAHGMGFFEGLGLS